MMIIFKIVRGGKELTPKRRSLPFLLAGIEADM